MPRYKKYYQPARRSADLTHWREAPSTDRLLVHTDEGGFVSGSEGFLGAPWSVMEWKLEDMAAFNMPHLELDDVRRNGILREYGLDRVFDIDRSSTWLKSPKNRTEAVQVIRDFAFPDEWRRTFDRVSDDLASMLISETKWHLKRNVDAGYLDPMKLTRVIVDSKLGHDPNTSAPYMVRQRGARTLPEIVFVISASWLEQHSDRNWMAKAGLLGLMVKHSAEAANMRCRVLFAQREYRPGVNGLNAYYFYELSDNPKHMPMVLHNGMFNMGMNTVMYSNAETCEAIYKAIRRDRGDISSAGAKYAAKFVRWYYEPDVLIGAGRVGDTEGSGWYGGGVETDPLRGCDIYVGEITTSDVERVAHEVSTAIAAYMKARA